MRDSVERVARSRISWSLSLGAPTARPEGFIRATKSEKPTLRCPLVVARGLAPWSFPLKKSEGDGALDGAGAVDGRARGPPRGRADLRKIRPEITGHTGPARLPALHRGVFTAAPGRAFSSALSAAVSQLLAGDRCVPGRSPDAARVRGCEPRPRAPHRRRPGIAGRPPPKEFACSPAPPSIRPAITTPHESAPQRTRWREQNT